MLTPLSDYKIEKINIKIYEPSINHWLRNLNHYSMVNMYASKVVDYVIKLELFNQIS